MRFLAILPTVALASSAFAWSDYENAVKCGRKNPAVNRAIEEFCAKGDIVVPSAYAKWGHGHKGYHVAISGTCNPPQWVPTQYCRMQFSKLCANGNAKGLGNQRYGNGGCQGWHIDRRAMGFKREADAEPEAMPEAVPEAMPEMMDETVE